MKKGASPNSAAKKAGKKRTHREAELEQSMQNSPPHSEVSVTISEESVDHAEAGGSNSQTARATRQTSPGAHVEGTATHKGDTGPSTELSPMKVKRARKQKRKSLHSQIFTNKDTENLLLEISTTVGGEGTAVMQQKTKRFLFDLGEISLSKKNCVSERFAAADLDFVYHSRGDPVFQSDYKDLPASVEKLYSDPKWLSEKLSKTLSIILSFKGSKVQRKVKYHQGEAKEEQDEDQYFYNELKQGLREIQMKYKLSVEAVSELFMRMSGDLERIRDHLQGRPVVEWTYLEDLALSKPDNSLEFRCLEKTKGREEIEKRKAFLIQNEEEEEKIEE